MPESRLVIFDLDNTLVMNRPAAKTAYEAGIRHLAKEARLEFDKLYNHWKKIVQRLQTEATPEKRAFEYSLSVLAAEHHISDQFIPSALKRYEKELLENLRPMPGAKELVSWLKEQNCLVTVAAGTDRTLAKKKLKATELYDYIDMIVSASDVGTMKPNNAYMETILKEYHLKPGQAAIVSDSKKEDLDPAKKMGLTVFELAPTNPHLTALKPQLSEFLTFAE